MAASPSPRRRPPKVDTERMEAIRSCSRHLKDLNRAQRRFPADVQVNTRGIPKFVPPIIEQSYCTSPAALCAELAQPIKPRPEVAAPLPELTELLEDEALCAELTEDEELLAEFEEEPVR